MISFRCNVFAALLFLTSTGLAHALDVFPAGSSWKYLLGTREASNPIDAWRAIGFNESRWTEGTAPIGYGEAGIGTTIPSSSTRRWVSVFFRKAFVVANPGNVAELRFSFQIDDGCAVWINGHAVGGFNVPVGELTYDTPSRTPLPLGDIEPTAGVLVLSNDVRSILIPGTNVIAVEAFNSSRFSSDFLFDGSLAFTQDQTPPQVVERIPPAGATVPTLTQLEILFDEDVSGVDPADLLINGAAATNVTAITDSQYVFEFPAPAQGEVKVAWRSDQGIQDRADPPNPFAGGDWSYTIDPKAEAPGVIISEFMADNHATLRDEDGDSSDWIELENLGFVPVDLGGWSLTTHSDHSVQWTFPSVTLLPNRYLVVFASGKDRTNSAALLHTNFKLNKAGGTLALLNPQGGVASEFPPAYPAQTMDVSFGRDRTDPSLLAFFPVPTPGSANTVGGPGFASDVTFSHPSGTFSTPFSLVLSALSTNAVIHYTLGTNLPTELSPVYSGPMSIAASVHVRARAFEPGLLPGPIASETYLNLSPETESFTSDLPIVVLHNLGRGPVPASVDQFVTVQVFEPKNGTSALTNAPDLAGHGVFHKRGRSTGGLPKASFFLEMQDEFGDDKNVTLAGLPSESDWALYAPNSFEPVLIHNPVAHELIREMGHYSSRTRFVEVYLKDDNGSPGSITGSDYNGIYVIEEKVKIGQNRVDIDKLRPENNTAPSVTGGYLMSIDSAPPGTQPFFGAGALINYLDPNYAEIITPQRSSQKAYLNDFFSAFSQALAAPDWSDPERGYAAFIDVPAAIDHHLEGVLTFNVDALRLSAYFFKPRAGKLVMGPVWDFDRTQGSADGRDFNPRRWRSSVPDYGTDMFNSDPSIFTNPWYSRFFQDIDFWQKWIDRYQALRLNVLSLENIEAKIDSFADEVRQAEPRDVARWRGSNGSDTTPRAGIRSSGGYSYNFPGTYQGEVDFMKIWYSNRLDFIDGQLLASPALSHPGGTIRAGTTVTLTGPPGATIYYTREGSDPRLPGGAVSPAAQIYGAPVSIDENVRLIARCYDSNHQNLTGPGNPPLSSPWSGPVEAAFFTQIPRLVITEIMDDPPPSSVGAADGGEFEFLELRNVGETLLNLDGFRLTRGVEFEFPAMSLPAGRRVLVVQNVEAFQSRYGTNDLIAGAYTGQLDNAGERLTLEGPLGEPILDFSYDNRWYPITQGLGFSLVIVDDSKPLDSSGDKSSWRPSAQPLGSPGLEDPPPPVFPQVLINEVLTHPEAPQADAIELENASDLEASIAGWFLSDNFQQPFKYRIPDGTVLPPQGFLVFSHSDFGADPTTGFGLSAGGDAAFLFSADGTTNLTGYVHGFTFGAAEAGVSVGRYVNSTGVEQFVAQTTTTLGSANSGPRVGPVVISEIMYDPPLLGQANNTRDEFIELHNISGRTVPLFDLNAATNCWTLKGGVDFTFPAGLALAPDGYLVVVGFDPVADPLDLAAFRNAYPIGSDVQVVGPWSGQLQNNGEGLRLLKPDSTFSNDNGPGDVPYVLVEAIDYSTSAPWPASASATGDSLQRIDFSAFGNDPINWQAAAPTPGRGMVGLRILSIGVGVQGIRLAFQAAASTSYSVLVSPDCSQGVWTKLEDRPAAASATNAVVLDPLGPAFPQRYYRIVTPALP